MRILMDIEFKNSTSDWRTLYGRNLEEELMKGVHTKENMEFALKAIAPNLPTNLSNDNNGFQIYEMGLVSK